MISTFADPKRGWFCIPNGVVKVQGEYALLRDFIDMVPGAMAVREADWSRVIRSSELRHGTRAVQDLQLTVQHEEAHYRQLMTTPMGLLLWRALNSLCADVEYIALECGSFRPELSLKLPLHRWYLGAGQVEYANALQSGKRTTTRPAAATSIPEAERRKYMVGLCLAIESIEGFLRGLLEDAGCTVGEFVEAANLAFGEMGKRSDLSIPFVWTTRLDPRTLIVADGRLSGVELIEAGARLEERRLLEALPDAAERIKDWEGEAVSGVYGRGYRLLMDDIGEVRIALAVLDAAFMTPIDPALAGFAHGLLVVEDVLPSFRLPRIVKVAQEVLWPATERGMNRLVGEMLCERAGLPRPRDLAEYASRVSEFSGRRSWGADHMSRGGLEWLNPARISHVAQGEFRRAMRARCRSPLLMPSHRRAPFAPLMMFFDDGPVFPTRLVNRSRSVAVARALILSYLNFVHTGVCLSLLGDGDCRELTRCEQGMLRRVGGESTHLRGPDVFYQPRDANEVDLVEGLRRDLAVRAIATDMLGDAGVALLPL
jgi:hypothetical protein